MSQHFSVWLLIALGFLAANLPFLNQRVLAFWRVGSLVNKPLALRLAELVLLYFIIGFLGRWLEQRIGQSAPQGWEFYAVSGALFLTFAFPGFIYQYLVRRGR